MKNASVLLLAYILPITIIFVVWTFGNIFLVNNVFVSQSYDHLISISSLKKDRIEEMIAEKKKDVDFISGAKEVKSIFEKEISFSSDIAGREAKDRADIIAKEIENFVNSHSGLTMDELISDEEFMSIATRKVGENGHSVIFKVDNFDGNLYGLNPDFFSEDDKKSITELVSQLDTNPSKNSVEIANVALSEDGSNTYSKYGYFRRTVAITSNKIPLGVGVFTSVDDYKITNKDSIADERAYLDSFSRDSGCYDIMLISPDEHIVFATRGDNENLGKNISWIDKEGVIDGYKKTLGVKDAVFSGPFFGDSRENMNVLVAKSVFDKDTLLGTVIIVYDFNDILRVMNDYVGFGETGDNYLTDTNGLLASPLRFKHLDLLVQSIKTDNFEGCISSDGAGADTKVFDFKNYSGNETLGTGLRISGSDWCLMTEIGLDEAFQESRFERIITEFVIMVIAVIVFVILHLSIRKYFYRKFEIDRKNDKISSRSQV